jgi:hypothetical protein
MHDQSDLSINRQIPKNFNQDVDKAALKPGNRFLFALDWLNQKSPLHQKHSLPGFVSKLL